MDAVELAVGERADLAELLSCLSPQQWSFPCPGGQRQVRDIVEGLLRTEGLGLGGRLARTVSGRVVIGPAGTAAAQRPRTTDELLDALTRNRRQTAPLVARTTLTQILISHQLVRRSVSLPRRVPQERLSAVLDHVAASPVMRVLHQVHGLRLVATDLEWAAGRGPLVIGPGEPLLMAMHGFRRALVELDGDGRRVLDVRVAHGRLPGCEW